MNDNSPFKFIDMIKKEKLLSQDQLKEFYPFLLNKLYYYYGKEKLANIINILWKTPKDFQYKMFCVFFKGLSPYGWIKKPPKVEDDKEIELIQEEFNVSKKIAREYLKIGE